MWWLTIKAIEQYWVYAICIIVIALGWAHFVVALGLAHFYQASEQKLINWHGIIILVLD